MCMIRMPLSFGAGKWDKCHSKLEFYSSSLSQNFSFPHWQIDFLPDGVCISGILALYGGY